jgi:hypothetical protein
MQACNFCDINSEIKTKEKISKSLLPLSTASNVELENSEINKKIFGKRLNNSMQQMKNDIKIATPKIRKCKSFVMLKILAISSQTCG